jgi:hypothetical protein
VWAQLSEPPAQYVVSYLPGAHGTFLEKVVSGLLFGDATPAAPTVMGEVGWVFVGWFPEVSATVEGDAIYVAQWVQQMFEVRFVDYDGRLISSQMVVYGGSATAPANPSRAGYTFTGWSPTFNYITSDLTVTAQYTTNSGSSGGGGSSNKPTTPPGTTTPPTETPPPTVTPPGNGKEDEPLAMWALVNLTLSAVGVILAILLIICVLLQKKKKKEHESTQKTKSVADQRYTVVMEQEEKKQKRLTLWLLTTIVLSIVSVVVFLLTEDMSLPMRLVDKWTIINAILFIVEIIVIVLHTRTQKTTNNQTEEPNSSNTTATNI